ncbi:MAG TPA: lysophospholipid acyltransferase family protein [Burkholderiaceae bacterium]|nr:lysophospholipid acyltransferase family protein [Burkholderiaceae bacterium]
MTRRLRAVGRLVRSVAHVFHGAAIALFRFPSLDAAQRHARVRWWSRETLRLMGLELRIEGALHEGGALLVANHVSWLDITAIHAVAPQARFVSKAAIQSWPVLSHLANAAGTLYLERERKRDALRVVHLVAAALKEGQTVAVFPEGTTADGRALLPFHANLLQAAVATGATVQPVAVRFSDSSGPLSRAVEFVGATTLVESLWRVACADGLTVHLTLLAARSAAGAERRALARQLQDEIGAQLARHAG